MEQKKLSGSETSTNEELDSVTEKDSALKSVEKAEDCRRKVWLRLASACMNAMVKKGCGENTLYL